MIAEANPVFPVKTKKPDSFESGLLRKARSYCFRRKNLFPLVPAVTW